MQQTAPTTPISLQVPSGIEAVMYRVVDAPGLAGITNCIEVRETRLQLLFQAVVAPAPKKALAPLCPLARPSLRLYMKSADSKM